MRFIKKLTKLLLGLVCVITLCTGLSSPAYGDDGSVYLGGFPAGFVLNTCNVEVIGVCDVPSADGPVSPARESGIRSGDIIRYVNGKEITSASGLTEILNEDFAAYSLQIERCAEIVDIKITPIKDVQSGKKRFGLLVKDSINGIGTVTYVDTNNCFASLGHAVTDGNGNLININGGTLYNCNIYDVKKGLRGNPGELKGIFDNSHMLGIVTDNTPCGIFGRVSSEFDTKGLKLISKGSLNQAEIGRATIYSTLGGSKPEEYDISIVKVDQTNKDNRNFVIKITDKRILDKSGGIVQGMSGSPIIQNGKLIGAVTHVFVNDPTRGYGIGIEHMCS